MKPTRGKYLCEVISDLRQTESGLFLADTIKEVPHRAKVLIAGDDALDKKCNPIKQSAKRGDIIHFLRVWHRERKIQDKDMIFIKEDEIVGVER